MMGRPLSEPRTGLPGFEVVMIDPFATQSVAFDQESEAPFGTVPID
jgi:hypothetical protein